MLTLITRFNLIIYIHCSVLFLDLLILPRALCNYDINIKHLKKNFLNITAAQADEDVKEGVGSEITEQQALHVMSHACYAGETYSAPVYVQQ